MENGCNLFDGADQPGRLSADTLTVYTHNAAGVRGGSVGFAVPAPAQSQFPPVCTSRTKKDVSQVSDQRKHLTPPTRATLSLHHPHYRPPSLPYLSLEIRCFGFYSLLSLFG